MASIEGTITVRSSMKPDSLKLSAQLVTLKMVHSTAFHLEFTQGDKAMGTTTFIRGVQGKVSRPTANRDYLYLLGKMNQIQKYITTNCAQTVIDDLFRVALDIFNRHDNRRRMGVEVMVLCILANPAMAKFELPVKYLVPNFVKEMLVSCRHRHKVPSVAFFWSKQSEDMLLTSLRSFTCLTKLVLPICNDLLLKTISVYCRELIELQIQLSQDATEEGLLSLSGRSANFIDQGKKRQWGEALCLSKDFGHPPEWYIKDALLFTPPPALKHTGPLDMCEDLLTTYPTGFGCLKLKRLRLLGEVIFPPATVRREETIKHHGPVIESGIYAMLLHLPELDEFVFKYSSLAVARFKHIVPPAMFQKLQLSLSKLEIAWHEALNLEELKVISALCPNLVELNGVCLANLQDGRLADQSVVDHEMCHFINGFHCLEAFSGSVRLRCMNSYLLNSGHHLHTLTLTSVIHATVDVLALRRFCPNLKWLEGRFSFDDRIDKSGWRVSHGDHYAQNYPEILHNPGIKMDSPWSDWKAELAHHPWRSLEKCYLNGKINGKMLQLLVAEAEKLEVLSISNTPTDMNDDGVAFNDSWITGLLEANPLPNLQEFTITMDGDRVVEEGFLTRSSLDALLNHAIRHSPKLKRVVGEWTKVPDSEITSMEEECKKKGLDVKIRNAIPYRNFRTRSDNERFYGMNEGYWRIVEQLGEGADEHHGAPESHDEVHFRHKRIWGYVYRPSKSEPSP